MSDLPEGTSKLCEKLTSYPVVNEAKEAYKLAQEKLSTAYPWAKTFFQAADTLVAAMSTLLVSVLSSYGSYVDPYAAKAADALNSLDSSYPSVQKPSKEVVASLYSEIQSKIPDSVKATIKSALLTMLKSLTQGLKQIKGPGEVGSMKELLSNTLQSFGQLKTVVDHASSLAANVSENETAAKAAAVSTDAILSQLGPDAKAKYEQLPDATAKAQFIAEEGWKKITAQMTDVNEKIAAFLPAPLKAGYEAAIKLVEKMSGDLSQQMPSNVDMMKRLNEALTTLTQYLETVQQWLGSEESESL